MRANIPATCLLLAALLLPAASHALCTVPEAEAETCGSLIWLGPHSRVWGLSADGSTIVGYQGVNVWTSEGSEIVYQQAEQPMRWARNGAILPLEMPAGSPGGTAMGVSADGAVIVGRITSEGTLPDDPALGAWSLDVRWVDGVIENTLPVNWAAHPGFGHVSADGAVAVGQYDLSVVRWDSAGFAQLPRIPTGHEALFGSLPNLAIVNGLSGDGRVITGSIDYVPVTWVDGEPVFPVEQDNGRARAACILGETIPPGPPPESYWCGGALWASFDGSVMVGGVYRRGVTGSNQAVVWKRGRMEPLDRGDLSGARAEYATEDVTHIVGTGWDDAGNQPVLWTQGTPQRLEGEMIERGLDPGKLVSSELSYGLKISDTGDLIAGTHAEINPDPLLRTPPTGEPFFHPKFRFEGFIYDRSIAVGIDVQPLREDNRVRIGRGSIRVLVFGHGGMDVDAIDADSLRLGPAAAVPKREGRRRDRNRDGFPDRLFRFRTRDTGLTRDDTEVCLHGTVAGSPFDVCAPIQPH